MGWVGNSIKRKLTTRCMCFNLVMGPFRKQPTMVLSSIEVEYCTFAKGAKEVTWF